MRFSKIPNWTLFNQLRGVTPQRQYRIQISQRILEKEADVFGMDLVYESEVVCVSVAMASGHWPVIVPRAKACFLCTGVSSVTSDFSMGQNLLLTGVNRGQCLLQGGQ